MPDVVHELGLVSTDYQLIFGFFQLFRLFLPVFHDNWERTLLSILRALGSGFSECIQNVELWLSVSDAPSNFSVYPSRSEQRLVITAVTLFSNLFRLLILHYGDHGCSQFASKVSL